MGERAALLTFLAETFLAPLTAIRRPVGRAFMPGTGLAAVAVGTLGSALAGWISAGQGLRGPAVFAAAFGGRLLLDVLLWIVVAALLGAAGRAVGAAGTVGESEAAGERAGAAEQAVAAEQAMRERAGAEYAPPMHASPMHAPPMQAPPMQAPPMQAIAESRPAWTGPVAVAAAQRAYLAPLAAVGRLVGAPYLVRIARPALWIWMLALLWLAGQERGFGRGESARVLALGLVVPAVLLIAGVLLAGLGWILAPLLPGGFTPFVPM